MFWKSNLRMAIPSEGDAVGEARESRAVMREWVIKSVPPGMPRAN